MRIVFSKQFRKEIEKAKHTYLISKIKELIAIVKNNPFQNPPPYEKLSGYGNWYLRRINEQHRLVYVVDIENGKIEFTRCWEHYGTL